MQINVPNIAHYLHASCETTKVTLPKHTKMKLPAPKGTFETFHTAKCVKPLSDLADTLYGNDIIARIGRLYRNLWLPEKGKEKQTINMLRASLIVDKCIFIAKQLDIYGAIYSKLQRQVAIRSAVNDENSEQEQSLQDSEPSSDLENRIRVAEVFRKDLVILKDETKAFASLLQEQTKPGKSIIERLITLPKTESILVGVTSIVGALTFGMQTGILISVPFIACGIPFYLTVSLIVLRFTAGLISDKHEARTNYALILNEKVISPLIGSLDDMNNPITLNAVFNIQQQNNTTKNNYNYGDNTTVVVQHQHHHHYHNSNVIVAGEGSSVKRLPAMNGNNPQIEYLSPPERTPELMAHDGIFSDSSFEDSPPLDTYMSRPSATAKGKATSASNGHNAFPAKNGMVPSSVLFGARGPGQTAQFMFDDGEFSDSDLEGSDLETVDPTGAKLLQSIKNGVLSPTELKDLLTRKQEEAERANALCITIKKALRRQEQQNPPQPNQTV